MKLGIMQPYFLPYIGYWQLLNAVDKFVILDDVNYIMRGYINRNTILLDGKIHRFTIPLKKASQNKLIMNTKMNFDKQEREKLLLTLYNAYKKSPFYMNVEPLLYEIINYEEEDLTSYIEHSIRKIADYLDISTEIFRSSKFNIIDLKGESRIIEICKRMKADVYINPSGGRELYFQKHFTEENIKLYFLDTQLKKITYKQNGNEFVNSLSIIDILMYNEKSRIKKFLEEYQLND